MIWFKQLSASLLVLAVAPTGQTRAVGGQAGLIARSFGIDGHPQQQTANKAHTSYVKRASSAKPRPGEHPDPSGPAHVPDPTTGTGGKVFTPKEVPDVFRKGSPYTYEKIDGNDKDIEYDILSNGNPIDDITIKTETEKSIHVNGALNKDEDHVPKDEGRMYLSDIMMGLWNKVAGMSPKDLEIVRYNYVTEKNTNEAIVKASDVLGREENASIVFTLEIAQAAPGSKEKEAFDIVVASLFGQLTERLNVEFSIEKEITKIEVTKDSDLIFTLE